MIEKDTSSYDSELWGLENQNKILKEYNKQKDQIVKDTVNHPEHYQMQVIVAGKPTHVESLDIIQATLNKEEYIGYLKGNCTKYMLRANKKNGAEDWKKAAYYNNILKDLL